jgi:hypothetical protein
MGHKTWLFLASAAGASVLLGWQLLRQEPDEDPKHCSASTAQFMTSFVPGMPYPDVVRRLQHMKLRYDAPKPMPGTVTDNTPLLYVRVRETGFVVSRREDVRIEFDKAGTLVRLDCMVILTGP